MFGYKITFEGLPMPVWGCETTVTNYSWEDRRSDNVLEIALTKAEYFVKFINQRKFVFENTRLLTCSISNGNVRAYSTPETQIFVTTIAVHFQKLNVVAKEFTADDCADNHSLLMPATTDAMSDNEMEEINILLHRYIKHNERNTEYDKIKCYSIFYNILAKIDLWVRGQLGKDTENRYNYYVNKVNEIIRVRYNTRLTKAVIAKELEISIGYLSSIYKSSTGKTISEYLLMFRMRKAAELLENINMPTAKIASAVGFDDETYFRKKFKQYFGMNIKEYKNIKHGNTLYHDKPTGKTHN